MLLFLIKYLASCGVKVPAVFYYISTRMLLASMTTLLFTIFIGPYFIRLLYQFKTGQSIRTEDCPLLAQLHQKKRNTPTMGGILILSGMLLSLILWMDLKNAFTLILFVSTIWLGLIGGIDDYLKMKHKNSKGLKGKVKLLGQLLLAALIGLYLFWPAATKAIQYKDWFVPPTARALKWQKPINKEVESKKLVALSTQQYAGRYYFPFFKKPLIIAGAFGLAIAFLFSLFVITGSSNAVNLTDGLDGLAPGTLVLTSGVLAVFAFLSNSIAFSRYLNLLYIDGSGEIGVYLCSMMGSCLGFLWYNGYPAQIFMGDTGSLPLGGVLGICGVLLRREFLLALAGGIFVAEALSVILQVASYRLRNKKRIFLCAPLHHHFEYKGWPETKVVLRFWIIGLILAMISLMSIKFQ